ncbi:MAG: FtsB family cell division protein [Halocynthiibacter sp.]
MQAPKYKPKTGVLAFTSLCILMGGYFVFAAVQGDFGLFNRIQIEANIHDLKQELALLDTEMRQKENLTKRLSDDYLDIDLLDEVTRSRLGYLRADEIVIN